MKIDENQEKSIKIDKIPHFYPLWGAYCIRPWTMDTHEVEQSPRPVGRASCLLPLYSRRCGAITTNMPPKGDRSEGFCIKI